MTRIKLFDTNHKIICPLIGNNQDLINTILEVQSETREANPIDLNIYTFIQAAKEIIFRREDKKIILDFVMYAFNVDSGNLEISRLIGQVFDENDLDRLLPVLAFAAIYETPVYPNEESLVPELSALYRSLLSNGFNTRTTTGHSGRYQLLKSINGKDFQELKNIGHIDYLSPAQNYSPLEISIIKDNIVRELRKLESAQKIIEALKNAISRLRKKLSANRRNENDIQRHLTKNPILFGIDYIRIKPKHKLGSDYEMDYALENNYGFYDLIEIESSNLPIYNKKGDPSSHLVHAEQQVLDWIDWIDKNYHYAESKLDGLINPKAYIIIGRKSSLSQKDQIKLKRRNATYAGKIFILTYDDLLNRAENLLTQLQSLEKNQ